MAAEQYNDWWVSASGSGDVGPSYGTPSDKQKHNAEKIYAYFSNLNWSLAAIAGMLGNIQYESRFNPADVYPRSRYPTTINSLADLDNSIALGVPENIAMGLVQWYGYGSTPPISNQIVSYAYRHGYEWYDGDIQLQRLEWEYTDNVKWKPKTINGTLWTWSNYTTANISPEEAARIWMSCYESTFSKLDERKSNAHYWYEYFNHAPVPQDWISGEDFSALATAYDPDITGVQIPYTDKDCIQFVQMVWRDIPAVGSSEVLCNPLGTNTLWRTNTAQYPALVKTFNTTSPDSQNPTPVLWFKDSISNYLNDHDALPAGCLLLHKISEAGPPAIPPDYAGDGVGNFAHIGIYIGNDEVMQSGGRDSSSVPGGGVHRSAYDSSAWNYIAYVVWVDPTSVTPPIPPEPPIPDFPIYELIWNTVNKRRKKVVKSVLRKF